MLRPPKCNVQQKPREGAFFCGRFRLERLLKWRGLF